MILDWLRVVDFRNIAQASLRFNSGMNFIVGANGHGKSNLLESVGLLATGRSFRRASSGMLRRHGQPWFRLMADVHTRDLTHHLDFYGQADRQNARLNGKPMAVASAMGQVLAAVILAPDSPGLVHGGPGDRRNYLDWVVFSLQRGHAATARDYHAALKARNCLLKACCQDDREMSAWEERLAVLGSLITWRRRKIVQDIGEKLPSFLEALGIEASRLSLFLSCQLDRHPDAIEPETLAAHYRQMLGHSRQSDSRLGVTSIGPHRDDLHIHLDSQPIVRFGSRGQKKRFILALKFSEAALLRESIGESPLFLLDDPSAELDADGIERLMSLLAKQQQQQIFLTTCNTNAMPLPEKFFSIFSVENGTFTASMEPTAI